MNILTKTKFSGLQLCKLVGITHNQFQSFKLAGLIEYKNRYTLQDVVYVAVSNNFRVKKFSWLSIKKLYMDVFKDLDILKNIDFLKLDIILIDPSKNNYVLMYKHQFVGIDFNSNILSVCQNIETGNIYYLIYINKIIADIIGNSKNLDLKVDVEKILLSA